MRLGTCPPSDDTVRINGQGDTEKALAALSSAGIRGCLSGPAYEEALWESSTQELARALKNTGVTLLEYNPPRLLQPVERSLCAPLAKQFVRLMELGESIGCLNLVACTGGFGEHIGPHPRNRSREARDLLKETCLLIAEQAAEKKLRARIIIELVYVSVIWSPRVLAEFVDEVNSPNIQGHMDIANCLTFDNIYDHSDFIRESFDVLGSRIHSAHLKDVAPGRSYFASVEERYVGNGTLDLRGYLQCIARMRPEFPAVIEHIRDFAEIQRSYQYIRCLAEELGIPIWSE